jgi:hypothetical protein
MRGVADCETVEVIYTSNKKSTKLASAHIDIKIS